MSAYIVPKQHIAAMVQFAMAHSHGTFRWVHWIDRSECTCEELHCADFDRASGVGQMLWNENVASVSARYPDCKDLPGPVGCDYQYGTHRVHTPLLSPVAMLKAIDGYEYQSCEHDGWATSSAKAFVDVLRATAIRALPGYSEAAWEIAA